LDALRSLLFELAGEDRLTILLELKKNSLKLSHLSKKLNFSVPETARNVSRLTEAKLITKKTDGCLCLTPYGVEVLNLLSGFDFLSQHRDYFLTHTLSTIPPAFSSSLPLLKDCQLVDDVMVVFSHVENMIQNAQKYVWVLSDQILASTLPFLQESLKRGVEFKLLLPKGVHPPKDALERVNSQIFMQAAKEGKFENRFTDKADVLICLSEKEVAALGFLNAAGRLDYLCFYGTDKSVLKWANDLFLHYWDKATRREVGVLFPDSPI
jgi:predicted transcriptional regulator